MSINRKGPLFDVDEMPWGRHAGKKLVAVPLWYWKWFLGQSMREYWPGLRDYAARRLELAEMPEIDAPKMTKSERNALKRAKRDTMKTERGAAGNSDSSCPF